MMSLARDGSSLMTSKAICISAESYYYIYLILIDILLFLDFLRISYGII